MVADSAERPRVVFIAGWGRSGSTLLGRLLGEFEGWVDVGEFNTIFSHSWSDCHCGCGSMVGDCVFWKQVLQLAYGREAAMRRQRLTDLYRACARQRNIFKLQRESRWSPAFAGQVDEFGREMARLYGRVLDVSGGAVVVDESKLGVEAMAVAASGHVDIRVVHLVRDPRAVAHSWQRSREQVLWDRKRDMRQYGALRSAIEWDVRNFGAERIQEVAPYLFVSYEDLVMYPTAVLTEIASLAETNVALTCLEGNTVTLGANHAFGGNPGRVTAGAITLRLDDEWRQAMPMRQQRLVGAVTWPFARRYRKGGVS